jgi:hypothetical protein
MTEQSVISRTFHGAEVRIPTDALFAAWLREATAPSSPPALPYPVPRIGEAWPGQGGINGGLARDVDGKPYWLIVSPKNVGSFEGIEYGGYGVDEPGAKSEFDGRANAIALINSSTSHPIVEKCVGFVHEGHSDFYVAAKRESAVLYANVKEEFEGWHLTSTQYSDSYAWVQYFGYGSQRGLSKGYKGRVRLVRRLEF